MKNLILLLLVTVMLHGTQEKEIETENNRYEMEHICSANSYYPEQTFEQKWNNVKPQKVWSFNREYKFIFKRVTCKLANITTIYVELNFKKPFQTL